MLFYLFCGNDCCATLFSASDVSTVTSQYKHCAVRCGHGKIVDLLVPFIKLCAFCIGSGKV